MSRLSQAAFDRMSDVLLGTVHRDTGILPCRGTAADLNGLGTDDEPCGIGMESFSDDPLGLSRDMVRFYARLGLLQPQTAGEGARTPQSFSSSDVRAAKIIRVAQSLGMSLKEIARIAKERREGASPANAARKSCAANWRRWRRKPASCT
jgi:hypothetical protein